MDINRNFQKAVVVSVLALASIAAQAATVNLKATLNASSEVPPNTSVGTGMLTATLDTTTNELKYHVTFSGLTGAATAAHFHGPAAPGANGAPQVPVKMSPIVSPIDGKATLTPAQAKELLNGKWYLNIHTKANPNGEIRGQLETSK
jgi:hypothetical protein